MLFFSFAGNWILGPANPSEPASNQAHVRLEFSDTLPMSIAGHGVLDSALRPVAFHEGFDALVPIDVAPQSTQVNAPWVAAQKESTAPSPTTPLPMQTPPVVDLLPAALYLTPLQAEDPALAPTPHQALKPSKKGRKGLAKERVQAGNQHWNSSWDGPRHGQTSKQSKGGKPGKGIVVRTTMRPIGNNRVVVRLFLNHLPSLVENKDLRQKMRANEVLAQKAQEVLSDLREVVAVDDQASAEEKEMAAQQERQWQGLRQHLLQSLRQRPGGLELMAELTPKQVEELLQKLNARSS